MSFLSIFVCLCLTLEMTTAVTRIRTNQGTGTNPTQLASSQDILFMPDGAADETRCSSAAPVTTFVFKHPLLINRVGALLRNPCPAVTVTLSFILDLETYRRDTENPLTGLPTEVRHRLGIVSTSDSQQLSPVVVFAASVTLSGLDFLSPTGPAIVGYFPFAQGLVVAGCSDTGSAPGIVFGPLVPTGTTDSFVSSQGAQASGISVSVTGFAFTLSTASLPAPPPIPVWLPGYPSGPCEIVLMGVLSSQLQTDNTNVICSYNGSPGISLTADGTSTFDLSGIAVNLTTLTSTVSVLNGAAYEDWTVCLARLEGENNTVFMLFLFGFALLVNAVSLCICNSYSDKPMHRRWAEAE